MITATVERGGQQARVQWRGQGDVTIQGDGGFVHRMLLGWLTPGLTPHYNAHRGGRYLGFDPGDPLELLDGLNSLKRDYTVTIHEADFPDPGPPPAWPTVDGFDRRNEADRDALQPSPLERRDAFMRGEPAEDKLDDPDELDKASGQQLALWDPQRPPRAPEPPAAAAQHHEGVVPVRGHLRRTKQGVAVVRPHTEARQLVDSQARSSTRAPSPPRSACAHGRRPLALWEALDVARAAMRDGMEDQLAWMDQAIRHAKYKLDPEVCSKVSAHIVRPFAEAVALCKPTTAQTIKALGSYGLAELVVRAAIAAPVAGLERVKRAPALAAWLDDLLDPKGTDRHPLDINGETKGPFHRTMSLAEVEASLVGEMGEHLAVFDQSGRQLCRAGPTDTAGWSEADPAVACWMGGIMGHATINQDAVLTHNHPSGSSPFSKKDLLLAIRLNLKQVRAVGGDGQAVWVLDRPHDGWGPPERWIDWYDSITLDATINASGRMADELRARGHSSIVAPHTVGLSHVWRAILTEAETHAWLRNAPKFVQVRREPGPHAVGRGPAAGLPTAHGADRRRVGQG